MRQRLLSVLSGICFLSGRRTAKEEIERIDSEIGYLCHQRDYQKNREKEDKQKQDESNKAFESCRRRSKAKNKLLKLVDKEELKKADALFISLCSNSWRWKKKIKSGSAILSDGFISFHAHTTSA